MNWIDSHVHVWDLSRFSYSWTRAVPPLNHSFAIEEYFESVRDLPLPGIVLVEADVDDACVLDEARYLLTLAERDNRVVGVIAGGRLERVDFENYLRQIAGHRKLRGIRRVLHSQPDDLALSGRFMENLKLLEPYGLTFDICILERQLPSAIHLVKRNAGVQFVLDHCGGPMVKAPIGDKWSEMMQELSQYPNVTCKISGLVGYAGRNSWTTEDVRRRVDCVVGWFGWDRLMFASDWPVCSLSTSPKEWMHVICDIAEDVAHSDRNNLFSATAKRVYRCEPKQQ